MGTDNTGMSRITKQLSQRLDSYRELSPRDKGRFWTDLLLNNAIYIILAILVIYVQYYSIYVINARNAFLSFESIVDILKKAASCQPSVFPAFWGSTQPMMQ